MGGPVITRTFGLMSTQWVCPGHARGAHGNGPLPPTAADDARLPVRFFGHGPYVSCPAVGGASLSISRNDTISHRHSLNF